MAYLFALTGGDAAWQLSIAGGVTLVLAYMQYRIPLLLGERLNSIEKTGKDVHTLVNSAMSVQLCLNATLSRRVADLTKDPSDIDAAKLAERMYQEHEAKQRASDYVDSIKPENGHDS